MRVLVAMGLIAVLASCGAQSEPIRPNAKLGLNIDSNGVTPSASVGARSGPLSIGLDL